jgi:PAS domain S-box-containing protein
VDEKTQEARPLTEYNEERFRAVAETAIDAIVSADSHGIIIFWNKAAERIFGYAAGDVTGKPLTGLMPERFREAHQAGLKRMVATGESHVIGKVVELAGLRKDGSEFPLELSLSASETRDGLFFTGIIRDITERKLAEWRLAAQYAGTRVLAEAATLDEATTKILQGICESLGWDLGAIWSVDQHAKALRCVNLWHSPELNVAEFEKVTRRITFAPGIGLPGRVWRSGQPAWIPDVVKDSNFPRGPVATKVGLHGAFAFPILIRGEVTGVIEFFSHEIKQPDEDLLQMLGAIGSQIGQFIERKLAEDRLRDLKEYIETILDSVPNPIIIIGQDERVEYMNKAAKQALGPRQEGESGIHLCDLIQTDETSQERLRAALRAGLGGSEGAQTTSYAGRPRQAADPLVPRPVSDVERPQRSLKIGDRTYQYAWFHIKAGPDEGKRIGLVFRDTTEESRLQDQLIQAEKWAGLGILAAGVGHELNNPLYSIVGLGEAILDETNEATMKEHAEGIVGQAKRMAKIIQDFTGHARAGPGDPRTEVDINKQLDQVLQMSELAGVGEGLEVRTDYQPLPRIKAKREEVQQVFANIITNAVQAMKGKGVLHLATRVTDGAITVRIRDTGPGIPQDYLPKVFDPFFTTKGQGEGKGLGLTVARRIVTKYGGFIQVETEVGSGATFILTFPVSG